MAQIVIRVIPPVAAITLQGIAIPIGSDNLAGGKKMPHAYCGRRRRAFAWESSI